MQVLKRLEVLRKSEPQNINKGDKKMWFEVRGIDDTYGLGYTYQTPEQALEEINASYLKAKEQGYDNRDNQWIIVSVQYAKITDEKGCFLAENKKRTLYCKVKFDGEKFVKDGDEK